MENRVASEFCRKHSYNLKFLSFITLEEKKRKKRDLTMKILKDFTFERCSFRKEVTGMIVVNDLKYI